MKFRQLGKGKTPDSTRKPVKEDVACIMYTSGTHWCTERRRHHAREPRGVWLVFRIIHYYILFNGFVVGAVRSLLGHHLGQDDSYLAYLPLAHILEYIVELSLFFVGMTIGYGRVKTLSDASVRNCAGDMREFKPSIMVGVPAVWETIRKGILGKVHSSGTLKKSVFNGAMAIKKANVPVLKQVVDAAILSQLKLQTGGRLRLAMSGGAALSRETQEFLSLALVTMLQGLSSSSHPLVKFAHA